MSGSKPRSLTQESSALPIRQDKGSTKRRYIWQITFVVALVTIIAMIFGAAGYVLFVRHGTAETKSNVDKLASYRCIPEYDRRLKRVVLSLSKKDTTLDLQHSLLAALPEYTKIIMLLPESNIQQIRRDLLDKPYGGRVQCVTYQAVSLNNSRVWLLFRDKDKLVQVDVRESDTASYHGSTWAQDMFEVM
ncbi:hypothetical protein LCGC14_2931780, partial [marine sediment metagenome]